LYRHRAALVVVRRAGHADQHGDVVGRNAGMQGTGFT
jgi:hypothetical protein